MSTNQKQISFRLNPKKTTSVSVNPVLFSKVVELRNSDEKETKSYIVSLAREIHGLVEAGVMNDVSLEVQNRLLFQFIDKDIKEKLLGDCQLLGRAVVRFVNPVTGRISKITTQNILIKLADELLCGGGEARHKKLAAIASYNKHVSGSQKCDTSHKVQSQIITELIEASRGTRTKFAA